MSEENSYKRRVQAKVSKVMGEYGSRNLKTSAGDEVKSHAQAIAIALSEARRKVQK